MLLKVDLKRHLIEWGIATILLVVYFLLMYFLTNWILSNIFIIPSVLYLSYTGLRWISRCGVFDVFTYQFSSWVSSFRKEMNKKYESAYDYKEHMKEEREKEGVVFLPWLILGIISLILCIVFSFYPALGR